MKKLLKILTSLTLVFSLLTLQIEGTRLTLNHALASEETPQPQEVKMTISQIMLFASMVVAPIMAGACARQGSVWIFAGGAAALLAGEITAYSMFNKDSKKRSEKVQENLKTNNDQEVPLRDGAQQYRDAARAVNTKSWLTMTAAIAYTAAVIMTVVEIATDYPKFVGSCYASTSNLDNVRYMANFSETRELYRPFVHTGGNDIGRHMAMVEDYNRFLEGRTQSMSIDEYEKTYQPYNEMISHEESSVLTQIFDGFSSLFMSKAHAQAVQNPGGGMTGALVSVALMGAIAGIGAAIGSTIPLWLSSVLSTGWTRGVVFGLFAGFAWAAFAELRKAKDKLEENAKVYDTLADKISNIEGPTYNATKPHVASPGSRGGPGININGRDANIPDGGSSGPCMSGSFNNMAYDADCSCLQSNSCTQIPTVSGNSQGFTQHLPPGFGASVSSFSSGVNDYLKGNSAGLDMANGAFGQNAAANLKRIKDQMLARTNDTLKKNKQAPIDLDKNAKAYEKQILDTMRDAMKRLPANQLAALQGTGYTGSSDKVAEKLPEAAKEMLASVAVPVPESDNKGSGVDFSNMDMGLSAADNLIGQEGEILDEFVTQESDISTKQSASIFQIISVRYLKSGYPRLLEKEKPTLE